MKNSTDCLNQAMFLAAESYSGSSYESWLFEAMDGSCDESIVLLRESETAEVLVLAA